MRCFTEALKESLLNLKEMTSDEQLKMSSWRYRKQLLFAPILEMTFGFFVQALVSSII